MRQGIAKRFIIGIFSWSTAIVAHAEAMQHDYIRPTARQVKLDLLASERGYYWVYHGKVLTQKDSIKVESYVPVQFVFTNRTNFDYQLELRRNPFRVIDGYGTYSQPTSRTKLPGHEKTVIEFPQGKSNEWFFSAKKLYGIKIDKGSYNDDTLMPRPPESSHEGGSSPRININPDVDWFNEVSLYSNMIDINSIWASGPNSLEVMYEHDWHDDYYGEASVVRKYNEHTNFYLGYEFERKDENSDGDKRTDRGMIGAHYAMGYIEGDLRYDSDKRVLFRISSEVPLDDATLLYADWDTDHDYRIKLSYKFSPNLAVVANYHARYHGGVGIRYSF